MTCLFIICFTRRAPQISPVLQPDLSSNGNGSTRDLTHKLLFGQPYTVWNFRRKFPLEVAVRLLIDERYGAGRHNNCPAPNRGASKLFRKASLSSSNSPKGHEQELRPRVETKPSHQHSHRSTLKRFTSPESFLGDRGCLFHFRTGAIHVFYN